MTALVVALAPVAALWAFTAVQTRRIEARYPPTGKRVDVGGGAIHVLDRRQRGEPSAARSCSSTAPPAMPPTSTSRSPSGCAKRAFAFSASIVPATAGASGSAATRRLRPPARPRRCDGRRQASGVEAGDRRRPFAGRRHRPGDGARRAGIRARARPDRAGQPSLARRRRLVLHAPARDPCSGRRSAGSSRCRSAWLGCRRGVASVSRPIRRRRASSTRRACRSSCGRSTSAPTAKTSLFAEAAVAALSPRYGAIRAPTEIVTGDRDGVVYDRYPFARALARRHPRRAAHDPARASATRPTMSRRNGSSALSSRRNAGLANGRRRRPEWAPGGSGGLEFRGIA